MPLEVPALSIPCYTASPPPLFKSDSLPAVSSPEDTVWRKDHQRGSIPLRLSIPPAMKKRRRPGERRRPNTLTS